MRELTTNLWLSRLHDCIFIPSSAGPTTTTLQPSRHLNLERHSVRNGKPVPIRFNIDIGRSTRNIVNLSTILASRGWLVVALIFTVTIITNNNEVVSDLQTTIKSVY